MGRPKKEKPNHGKYFEVKKTIGHKMNGDPIRKSFYSETSRSDADKQGEDWIVAQKVAEQAGEPFIEKDYTFAEWARKWLEIYKKPNVDVNTYKLTYENTVEKYLVPAFGAAKMDDVRPVDVQEFFGRYLNLSESVLKKLHMCLWSIFDTGIDNDICQKNPVKRIRVKSRRQKNMKRVYTETQMKKVKEIAKESDVPEVYLILNTGIRRGEVLGIHWEDFDKKNSCILIKRTLAEVQDKKRSDVNGLVASRLKENPPKWGSYRTIPISGDCAEWIANRPHNGPYIFPNRYGGPQRPNTWAQKMKRFMIEIHARDPKIPILSPHELRHTFATHLRRRGVDIYTIQKIMGHKDINMDADLYVHNELNSLRRGLKLGTSVVQASYRRKYRAKRNKKEATQNTK